MSGFPESAQDFFLFVSCQLSAFLRRLLHSGFNRLNLRGSYIS